MAERKFIPFPILTTERLTLRQLSINDDEQIFALRSNPAINKYLDRQACKTIEDARVFITQILENTKRNDSLYWAIALTKSKSFVGTICLFDFSTEDNKCEIGFELLTTFQGQGIMKEAIAKVIDNAFQQMYFQKIEAFTHKENQNSIKLLENVNFKKSSTADKENTDYIIFNLTN